jgi:two-component system chemotaxis response regulator CheB
MIRVLIVEDSPLAAGVLTSILEGDPEIKVIGVARNGLEALELAPRLAPDLITMDVWMPGMDGFATVEQIMAYHPTPILVITTSLANSDVNISLTMLAAGALDVIEKPSRLDEATWERSKRELIRKIKLLARVRVVTHLKGRRGRPPTPPAWPIGTSNDPAPPATPAAPGSRPAPEPVGEGVTRFTISAPPPPGPALRTAGTPPATLRPPATPPHEAPAPAGPSRRADDRPAINRRRVGSSPLATIRRGSTGTLAGLPPHPPGRPGVNRFAILTIASSTGGPQALLALLRHLPADFPLPTVIVQHIAAGFTQGLAEWLGREARRPVQLAVEGVRPGPGQVLLAPDGYHLVAAPDGRFHLDDGPPLDIRPAADILMHSIAAVYGDHAIGVILTGMGRDGAHGLKEMRWGGAYTIAQDEQTSLIFGMPRAAITLGVVDEVLALDAIAPRLADLVTGRAP